MPNPPPAELGLAHALAKQDRLADAAPHFRAAAQLDPTIATRCWNSPRFTKRTISNAEAIAIYQQFPENAAAQEHIGQLHARKQAFGGCHRAARSRHAERSHAGQPAGPGHRLSVRETVRQSAAPARPERRGASPPTISLRMMYGRGLRDSQEIRARRAAVFQATRLKPDSREAWNELAGMLYMTGEISGVAGRAGPRPPARRRYRRPITTSMPSLTISCAP